MMIPLERRLQTMAVWFWISSYLTMGLLSIILMYYLMYSSYWWLTPMYLTWMVYDLQSCNTGGRRGALVDWVRGSYYWKLYANFFPMKLIKTHELDPTKVLLTFKLVIG